MPPFKKRRSNYNNYNGNNDGEGGSQPYGRGGYRGGRGGYRGGHRGGGGEDEPASSGPAITIQLDKKKKVTVRSYKGVKLIDIREFFTTQGDNGETLELPGKKGISLTQDAWEKLVSQVPAIEDALESLDSMTSQKAVTQPVDSSEVKKTAKVVKSEEVVKDDSSEGDQEEDDEEDENSLNLANDLEKEIARHEAMAEVKRAGKDSDESSEED